MTPISFLQAATDLEALCDKIDNIDEIDSALTELFSTSLADFRASIDRRIQYIQYAASQLDAAAIMRDKWQQRIKRFQRIQESVKAQTMEIMRANSSIPFNGTQGSFRIQRNSNPSLIADIERIRQSHPFADCYFKVIEELDKDRIRKDLLAGEVIDGAQLVYNDHLRISLT